MFLLTVLVAAFEFAPCPHFAVRSSLLPPPPTRPPVFISPVGLSIAPLPLGCDVRSRALQRKRKCNGQHPCSQCIEVRGN